MSFIPKPHEIYKHFKGNLYQIVALAEHSETGEQLVIYQALYGDFKIYARPLPMFTSRVDKVKYPQVPQEFRFELQGADSARQRKETATDSSAERAAAPAGAAYEEPSAIETTNVERIAPESTAEPEEELHLDPMVLEFLDADSYEARLNILAGLHHRITDDMITTMALACDIEVEDGDLEERYEGLRGCLLTLEKYECNRLR